MRRSMTMMLAAATALGSILGSALGPAFARSGDGGAAGRWHGRMVHHYARYDHRFHSQARVVVIPRYPDTFGGTDCYYTDTEYPALYNDCSPFGRRVRHDAAYWPEIGPGYPLVFNGTRTFNGTDCRYTDSNYPAFYNDCRPVRPW